MEWEEIRYKIYPWVKSTRVGSYIEYSQSEMDLPAFRCMGDLVIMFVIDRNDWFEGVQRSMLPHGMDDYELLSIASENLARDVRFQLLDLDWGAYGIYAGGNHEAGAICFPLLWKGCADTIGEDLVFAVPAKDIVMITGVSNTGIIEQMIVRAHKIFFEGERPLTDKLFLYSRQTGDFMVYE